MTIPEAHERLLGARAGLRLACLNRGTSRINAIVQTLDETLDTLLFLMEAYDFHRNLKHSADPLLDIHIG